MDVMSRWEEFDLHLSSGRVHAARSGGPGPLVLCFPGLSANLRSFDFIGGVLAEQGFRVVTVDPRGRGRSEPTPAGTYGWPAHAADVAEMVDRLGAGSIHLVGWSMGAYVAMQLASMRPHLLDKVVLIDACGTTGESANALIRTVIQRLGVIYPSLHQYLHGIKQMGTIVPWDPLWERYFAYELEPVERGVRARTNRAAVIEDFDYGTSHDPRRLWPALSMPALLVRAAQPLVPGGPFIVAEDDRDAFAQSVPGAKMVEVDANHYGVATHSRTAEAIQAFLASELPGGDL
ncbi:MAG TPA: alpha/beta hydrolase [Pseudonocardiaceae bacterium]|jgi:pimeloyl-ACP methyl ester carboxylesterase|nr:alpha/beta hydrolase [Pseudonocardiaceae bacterium]